MGWPHCAAEFWDKVLGQSCLRATSAQRKTPDVQGFSQADEGTRTLDLLHGKHEEGRWNEQAHGHSAPHSP
jgi:hypothetical protein